MSIPLRLRRASAAAAAAFALLAAVEGLLRLKKGAPPLAPISRNLRVLHLDIHEPFFRAVDLGGGRTRYEPRRPESLAKPFEQPKPANARRVVVVGGSVSIPYGQGPGAELADRLAAAMPGKTVEVVACGMAGYDSWRESLVLREALSYTPDLIVLLSGNNEYFDQPRLRPVVFKLGRFLLRFWVFRALRRSVSAFRRPAPLPREARAARFEGNLRKMVRAARRREVPIVLCTLPANLRDAAPSDPWTLSLPMENRGFHLAWAALEFGELRQAERRFRLFSNSAPAEPFSRFYRAKVLERLGRGEEAAEEYRRAADLDDPGERTSPARNAIIRRVAAEEGAVLADLEAEFSRVSRGGIPDRALFKDGCHIHSEYYRLVNETLIRALHGRSAAAIATQAQGGLAPNPARPLRPYADGGLIHAAFGRAAYGMRKEVVRDQAVNMLALALEAEPARVAWSARTDERVARIFNNRWYSEYARPVNQPFVRRQILIHLGAAYRRMGRLEPALACFEDVLASDPDNYQGVLGRAITLARMGRLEPARRALRELVERRPDRKEPGYWLDYLAARGRRAAR